LVTGSSRGIGFGIAKAFSENGDRVILNGLQDSSQLKASMDALDAKGFIADLSDYNQAQDLFNKIGAVDLLVNNAGSEYFGLFNDMTPQEYEQVIKNNLFSVLNATYLFTPSMVKNKKGVVINITSIWGITGASCEAVYAAAKAGVIAFTKSMAKELGPSGVRVNAIACGAFETRMNERLTYEEKEAFSDNIPLSRFGEPGEAGALAVFLASDKTGYLTGQVITLDGGLV
jgi:3-oxoacyl-[acyl-carrier protein] reductase